MDSRKASDKKIARKVIIDVENHKFVVIDDKLANAIDLTENDFVEEKLVPDGILVRKLKTKELFGLPRKRRFKSRHD